MNIPMSNKSPAMIDAIEKMFPGTKQMIAERKCPMCTKPIVGFRDLLSEKEYEISGMCQACQDSVFGTDEN